MKMKCVVLVCLLIALALQTAQARSLEDVLKEKGVITEEDYREVTKSRPLDYKLGEGFTFTSPDEKFKGSVGSQLQLRYTFFDRDNEANPLVQDQSEFRLRRIKLYFNGYAFTPELTYKLQMNFAEQVNSPTNSSKLLEETYLNYRFMNEAQLRFGQDKTPFARQELVSTSALQFVERSFVTDAFKPGYDTGLKFHGKAFDALVAYDIGVYGGVGQGNFRTTDNNALAARLAINPLGDVKYSESDVEYSEEPLFSVAASYFMDTLRKSTAASGAASFEANNLSLASASGWLGRGIGLFGANEDIDTDSFEIDSVFKWRGLSVQGEYFLAQGEGKTSGRLLRAHGFYAQAGYFIILRHLELAARYSWMDPNRDSATSDIRSEVTGAVSYYFDKHNLKIQGDISDTHDQSTSFSDDMMYRIQVQLLF